MSEESSQPDTNTGAGTGGLPAGLELSDEFKTFLMSHKAEVMRLLKDKATTPSRNRSEKKDSSSESESSMARRGRRSDSASSDCSSEDEKPEIKDQDSPPRRVVVQKRREHSRSWSRERPISPPSAPKSYAAPSRRHRRREPSESRSRSRSPSAGPPRRQRRREPSSESRSRSRSRSSTPARYERHMKARAGARRDHADDGCVGGRAGYAASSSGRGRDYTSRAHEERHHHHNYESSRGGGGGMNYESGVRHGGYIRARNMIEDGRDDPRPSKCLGVFAMPPWVREFDLRNMFEPYGEITQCNVVINRYTGQCRGYGFVYYEHVEEAKRARAAMREVTLDGVPLRVDYSVTDQRRPSYKDRE